jgi:pyruvate ferredoxin oxidoreductase gamma subunit
LTHINAAAQPAAHPPGTIRHWVPAAAMSRPIEIRIHGRGGQGNVVAAYLLAAAAIRAGFQAQAFPAFGAERRGAPVTAFVRIRRSPIARRNEIEHPDMLIVQDPKLLAVPGTTAGLRADGGILVNAEADAPLAAVAGARLVRLPASRLAEATIGRDVPNVALVAGLAALAGLFPPEALFAALEDRFRPEVAARNRQTAEAAAAAVTAGAWEDLAREELAEAGPPAGAGTAREEHADASRH